MFDKLFFFYFLFFPLVFFAGSNVFADMNQDKDNRWNLVWSDEFAYTGLPDAKKWTYDIGGHGWGNNELQNYTSHSENARVEGGVLIIEAHHSGDSQPKFTSARLRSLASWTYGKFEIRARLPSGRGTWPAIWMLASSQNYGQAYWPENGEIDIMEHVGFDPGVIHGSIHCKKYNWMLKMQRTAIINVPDASDAFHNYVLVWTPEKIEIYVDEYKYFTFQNEKLGWESWPFDRPQYLLLNIAVGGNWGGQEGVDESIFPQKMEIDYVRIYQL